MDTTNAKKNSAISLTTLEECVNLLARGKKDFNLALAADLITALEKMGNNNKLINEIREKGLPSHIIASSDIFSVCQQHLSKYGKVVEMQKHSEHNKDVVIMMGWAGEDIGLEMHPVKKPEGYLSIGSGCTINLGENKIEPHPIKTKWVNTNRML